jgi:hypothetical protein
MFSLMKEDISLKTMEIMVWATTDYDADYVMKMDDDSFLHLPKFVLFTHSVPLLQDLTILLAD